MGNIVSVIDHGGDDLFLLPVDEDKFPAVEIIVADQEGGEQDHRDGNRQKTKERLLHRFSLAQIHFDVLHCKILPRAVNRSGCGDSLDPESSGFSHRTRKMGRIQYDYTPNEDFIQTSAGLIDNIWILAFVRRCGQADDAC